MPRHARPHGEAPVLARRQKEAREAETRAFAEASKGFRGKGKAGQGGQPKMG